MYAILTAMDFSNKKNIKLHNYGKTYPCPVCGSEKTKEWYPANIDLKDLSFTYEFKPGHQKTFRVVRCYNCTHAFCSPLPKNIYKYYKDVVDNEYLRHSQTNTLTARAVLKTIHQYMPSGNLLDVGCATGDFLNVAKKFGYSAEGLELSEWSSEIARKKGIHVYDKQLKLLTKKLSGRYDIITMWGVIEHFENPSKEMQYINRLLKPNGILVLWTGDVNGVMSHLLGRRWWYWQGQHIQYFTHSSLNYLAMKCGFEHILTKRYPIAATYDQIENSLSRYEFQPYVMWLVKLLFKINPICYLSLPGEMFWLGRKVSQI